MFCILPYNNICKCVHWPYRNACSVYTVSNFEKKKSSYSDYSLLECESNLNPLLQPLTFRNIITRYLKKKKIIIIFLQLIIFWVCLAVSGIGQFPPIIRPSISLFITYLKMVFLTKQIDHTPRWLGSKTSSAKHLRRGHPSHRLLFPWLFRLEQK